MMALIFANGNAHDGVMVQRFLAHFSEASWVVAADGGARMAQQFHILPDIIIGDLDSLNEQEIAYFQRLDVKILAYPPAKDETDLELALAWVVQQGATEICVVGAIGGRFDQTLANVYLLTLPILQDCEVNIVSRNQEIRLLRPGNHSINGKIGDTISLIPLKGDIQGISTEYLQYPLSDEVLHFGPARGVSNMMQRDVAHVAFESGLLLLIHTDGKAE
jgi:thiamine pyrophosphokinase